MSTAAAEFADYVPPTDREEGRMRAGTILRQLGNRAILSLGVRDVLSLDYGGTTHDGMTHKGGLTARVGNGRWRMVVTINALDLYDVSFVTIAGRVAHTVTDVYNDNLAEACIVGLDAAMWPR